MNGKTLGHYRVGEQLGRGGMGEVYVADDLNLNRKVALKFLPDAFAGDPERMARFEREAKVLASLNHPNIAAIHGLEQAEGKRFLVLELVEGKTLAQRISKGALSVDETLGICKQIADGLEAAHEKGVIHRDLKPANVIIAEGDKVKILDFGLAKALSDETQSIDSSESPTLTEAMTRPGVILGTAAYMSPEQAKGKSVDKRADIWAFGCILYECLTGKRAFEGETVTETLASVLTKEPEWEKIPPGFHPMLSKCLERDPKKRLRDIGDVFALLESSQESVPAKRPWILRAWAAIAALFVIALAVAAFLYFSGREPVEARRFHIAVPPMPDNYSLAISPDGRAIAFVASSQGARFLFVCDIGSVTPRQIDGTEGAAYPFWSPDSHSVAFFARDRLMKVDVSGGPPVDVCAARGIFRGTWNSNGVIVFSEGQELRRISAAGGESSILTTLDEFQNAHVYPHFLPDGRHYLYTAFSGAASKSGIYVGSLDSKEKKRVLTSNSPAIYVEPEYLLFQRNRALFAVRFNAKELSFSGEEVRIADNVAYDETYQSSAFGASNNGVLIYIAGREQRKSQFVWFDRNGKQLGIAGEPGAYSRQFDLSPDGKQIALGMRGSAHNPNIWVMDWARNIMTRFTDDASFDLSPRWSPDGHRITFASYQKRDAELFEKRVGSTGSAMALLNSYTNGNFPSWSEDGRYMAYVKDANPPEEIYGLPLLGDRKPFRITQSPGIHSSPDFSSNGKWLAYDSNESGTSQVYLISFPSADQRHTISNNGGVQPRWRKDGKELYYLALDGKLMAVDITAGAEMDAGTPRMLFNPALRAENSSYAVTPDGQRFLLLKPLGEVAPIPIAVVLNWTSVLKK